MYCNKLLHYTVVYAYPLFTAYGQRSCNQQPQHSCVYASFTVMKYFRKALKVQPML